MKLSKAKQTIVDDATEKLKTQMLPGESVGQAAKRLLISEALLDIELGDIENV